jgi:hypothetical protein
MNRNASGHYATTATGGETVRAFVPFPLPPEPPLDLSGNRQPYKPQLKNGWQSTEADPMGK